MKLYRLLPLLLAVCLAAFASQAAAATYSFSLDQANVHVYWNEDGSMSLAYQLRFSNDAFASPIDYVDLGLPNSNFDVNGIRAEVDGAAVFDISASGYQGSGVGVAIGLGERSIQPGRSGTVIVYVERIWNVLYEDSQSDEYASAVFSPTWFGSEYVHGTTDYTVTFHLPPGITAEEPRWHAAPAGWPAEPETGFDQDGRIIYTWHNPSANGHTRYQFGASFPKKYVPASAVANPSIWQTLGISADAVFSFLCCGGFGAFFLGIVVFSVRGAQKRKLQYLPPKIAIEGHGIKRGLTAVEAAILLEQGMDKVLSMILFGVIKKGAAEVVKRDPLEIKVSRPLPENLHPYEVKFLEAFEESSPASRRRELQLMMVDLVKTVSNKMKGFSRRETVAYYRDITRRAWAEVEAANTPEVKSEKFDQALEWTMLDKDYEDRTREVFHGRPVIIPTWWHRYDPAFGRPMSTPQTVSAPGGQISLPHLPGSDFAASMVNGMQNFSANVVGNLTEFTSTITEKTNPIPVTKSSGGGRSGACACACACACAGCACACAGGGR